MVGWRNCSMGKPSRYTDYMNNTATFTKEELFEIRQACSWARMFWQNKSKTDKDSEYYIANQYLDLWYRVDAEVQRMEAQEIHDQVGMVTA